MDKHRLQELIGPDYTLQWVVGNGGMSTVWLADDNAAKREVAIKVLRPEFSNNDEFLARFRNEAETAQKIVSDNVVKTYDYREVADPNGARFCFMALEYVRGESLEALIARDKQLPEALALDVMEKAANGLSDIHSMGMVHRDVKPGNLLITQNGQVKITDFGIAKAAAAVPLTRTGMVVGTAQYVSPEQAQGMEVTSATDTYSLGVVGYEMLAGKRPFVGDSSVSVALAHISQAPDPLPTTVSAQARELIGFCLRKDPQTRYASGADLARAIAAVRGGHRPPQPVGMVVPDNSPSVSQSAATSMIAAPLDPAPPVQPVQPAQQAKPPTGLIALLALLVTGAAAALGFYFLNSADEQPAPEPETTLVTQWVTPSEPDPVPPTTQETSSPEPKPPAPEPKPPRTKITVRETTQVPVTVTETKTAPPPAPAPPPPINPEPDPSPPELPRTTQTSAPVTSAQQPPLESLASDISRVIKTPSQ